MERNAFLLGQFADFRNQNQRRLNEIILKKERFLQNWNSMEGYYDNDGNFHKMEVD